MADKVSISVMSDTDTVIMIDKTHKVVIMQINSEELYVHSPEDARYIGEALISAADHIQPKKEEKKEEAVKPALVQKI